MSAKKPFLLRLNPALHKALEKWAADELRSINGQIEYLLQEAARHSGRLGAGVRDQGSGIRDQGNED
ncbi:MAG: toxin-antitoxin system HicB family antitoxin [Acidobacteriota bacterium]